MIDGLVAGRISTEILESSRQSGSGWESNPPGIVSDTSPVLKTGAITRSANASEP